MTDLKSMLATWAEKFRPHAEGVDLPPHHEQCLGCGPDNPHGHHLQVRRYGDGVVAEHTFDNRHVGAPGIAHGGAVATVIDDLYGFLLYLVGAPAVTRQLTVDYRAPVMIGTPLSDGGGRDESRGPQTVPRRQPDRPRRVPGRNVDSGVRHRRCRPLHPGYAVTAASGG